MIEEQTVQIFMSLIIFIMVFLFWLSIPSIPIVIAYKLSKSNNMDTFSYTAGVTIIIWNLIGILGVFGWWVFGYLITKEPDAPGGAALGWLSLIIVWGIAWFLPLGIFIIFLVLLLCKKQKIGIFSNKNSFLKKIPQTLLINSQ